MTVTSDGDVDPVLEQIRREMLPLEAWRLRELDRKVREEDSGE